MEPCFLSAASAAKQIREGGLTSEALVRSCLERIDARDPDVKAWLHVDPRAAIAAAREADKRPAAAPLHGLPIGVKDIMDVAGMPTTHNSANWQGYHPSRDAACVAIARASGAVILGKTDTVEFAAAGRTAATRHPENPAHTPGGSSSGSAASVADHQVQLAFGTQTAGSIIRPASFNGIYAIKPTWGGVSREGVKQYADSLDTIGWFGRSLADLALVAQAFRLLGPDRDAIGKEATIRVGLCRTPYWSEIEPGGELAVGAAAERLERAGIPVAEFELPAAFAGLREAQDMVMMGEGRVAFLDEYLVQNERLGPDFVSRVENTKGITSEQMIWAYDLAAECRRTFESVFTRFDVVLAPAAPGEAPEGLSYTGNYIFNALWTLLHVPCLAIPCVRGSRGLPVGIQLIGPRFSDTRLLGIAQVLAPIIDSNAAAPR